MQKKHKIMIGVALLLLLLSLGFVYGYQDFKKKNIGKSGQRLTDKKFLGIFK